MSRVILVGSLFLLGCSGTVTAPPDLPPDPAGLHNVRRLTDKLLTGSSPEGDAGFASLKQLGVQTILSVDGAAPEVERARRFGLRYVHLPIGYDGVSREQGLRLARAVRDLPGPVYLHCHHGKHRAPAAAAVVRLCLDPACPVEQVIEEMKQAGTDLRYRGLYASPAELTRPSDADLDAVSADFPEVAVVPALAQRMVRIDETWQRLQMIRAANWTAPKGHPDLDPAHEALQLREHYRELARLPDTARRPADYRAWVQEVEEEAGKLEAALRALPRKEESIQAAVQANTMACTRCHAKYRDVPWE